MANRIKIKFTSATNNEQTQSLSHYPLDSGYGWIILAASFLMQACSFGVMSGFGVFLEFYKTQTFKTYPTSLISFIGTVAPATTALASMFTGRLCDLIGVKKCTIAGAIFILLSHLLASFSTEVWHLIVTQGFLFGLGGALVYIPANIILTQWFVKRRGLVVGIGAAGSGLGGLVVNLLNVQLLSLLDLQWTLRINGLLYGSLLLLSAWIIKPNYALTHDKPVKPFKISMIFNPRFGLFAINMFLASFSFFVPLYFLPSYATYHGLSKKDGAMLVALINGFSAVGRISVGFVSDTVGHLNGYILCFLFSSIMLFIWSFCINLPTLIIFAILYGIPSGGFAGGFPSTCAQLFGQDNLGALMGIVYAPTGFGDLLGPVLAGLIYDTTGNYRYIIYYASSLFSASTICNIIIRFCFMPKTKE